MARGNTTTRWIIAGAAAVVVVAASVIVIALSLRSDPPTERVEPTQAPTTGVTTTAVPTTRPGETTTTEPAEVDEVDETVTVGQRERRYKVVTPQDLDDGEELPTVVVLHGLGVSAEGISRAADWRQAVERERFVAVFPQGEANSWNMGPCCLPASLLGIDDDSFLEEVLDRLRDHPAVDEGRLYLNGFSNGALMAYQFACAHPGVFDAIAPMAGANLTGCYPDEPVSLLHQHSDPDTVVPYEGGLSVGNLVSSAPFPSVPASVGRWADRSGCDAEPVSEQGEDVEWIRWQGCPDDIRVELVRIPGKGHAWPDTGDYDALETLLEFFGIS